MFKFALLLEKYRKKETRQEQTVAVSKIIITFNAFVKHRKINSLACEKHLNKLSLELILVSVKLFVALRIF